MKRSKCDFFKIEIHYLGHLISPEGIRQLPNKLDCIKHMPVPKNAKEIKQFLGLTGYYRKIVPRFADISRPLTTLTKKDKKFEWTPACQKSFDLLKETLCGEPVLKYTDTSKPYTHYTDASKFGCARFSCLCFLGLCINIYCATLGNVARVYPWIVQGLTFLSA